MEDVMDRLIAELDDMRTSGELDNIIDVSTDTKWDDPGIVLVTEYPYFYVAPVDDQPKLQTAGLAGYDVRVLTIDVCLVINQSDYFDPSVEEVPGSRVLVQAMSKVSKRLRRLSKTKLDGLVRGLMVARIGYVPDARGEAFVRMAVMRLVVEMQYQHEE
jgi:hypothetical protein